jgi:hypothetical protein
MDEIDRILSSEKPIEPSSHFTRRVLDEVRREARTPPPIPFPWRRIAVAAGLLAFASTGAVATPAVREPTRRVLETVDGIDWAFAGSAIGTLALALLIALASLWSAWRAR